MRKRVFLIFLMTGLSLWAQDYLFQESDKGDLSISFCGNGVHEDGELCFLERVQVSMEADPFDIYDLEVGFLNAGSNLDFVAGRTVDNSFHARLGSGNGSFYATYNYSMGSDFVDLALGDFDGDGKTDLIGTDRLNDRVYIRWGHSTWSTYNWYGVGNGPASVAVADLNGDGLDDFVTANAYSTAYTVGLRSGTTFNRTTTYNGDQINRVRLADVDDDGDMDLVFSEGTEATCRRNNGAGSFGTSQPINLGVQDAGVQDFALGDINNDGDADMIAIYYYNASMVRVLSDGDGSFSGLASASAGLLPHCVDLHDMDKDGNLDILLGGASGIFIFLGDGHGNFIKSKTISATQVSTVRAGDFNHDGSPDLIYTCNILGGKTAVMLQLANP